MILCQPLFSSAHVYYFTEFSQQSYDICTIIPSYLWGNWATCLRCPRLVSDGVRIKIQAECRVISPSMTPCWLFWLRLLSFSSFHQKLHLHGCIFWIYHIVSYLYTFVHMGPSSFLIWISSDSQETLTHHFIWETFHDPFIILLGRVDFGFQRVFPLCLSHSSQLACSILCFYYGTRHRT